MNFLWLIHELILFINLANIPFQVSLKSSQSKCHAEVTTSLAFARNTAYRIWNRNKKIFYK